MKKEKKNNKKKGFTLIEILVVVLIIGVLVAIALPSYMRSVERSRATGPMTNLGSIAKAQNRQRLATMHYTDNVGNLDISLKDETNGEDATGNTFESEFYTYKVYGDDEEAAIATRKNVPEDQVYELSVDYSTGQIYCRPITNHVCIDLRLEEGRDFVQWPQTEDCNPRIYGYGNSYTDCVRTLYKDGTKHERICSSTINVCMVFNNDGKKIQQLSTNTHQVDTYDPETGKKISSFRYKEDGTLNNYSKYDSNGNLMESVTVESNRVALRNYEGSGTYLTYFSNNSNSIPSTNYYQGTMRYSQSYDSTGQISSVTFWPASGVSASVSYNSDGSIKSSSCTSGDCDNWTPPERSSFTYTLPQRPQTNYNCLEDNPDNPIVCGA